MPSTVGRRRAGFLSFAGLPPSMSREIDHLSFRQRVLAWANGHDKSDAPACVFPSVMISFYALKMALYVALYYYGVRDTAHPLWGELNVKRFIIYSILTDAIGLNATNGPLGFRSLLGSFCIPLFNFFTPGTITGPLLPNVTARRSKALVVGYAMYLLLLLRALTTPSVGAPEVLPVVGALLLLAPFDFVIAETSRCEHYGYMLFSLAFPGSQWIFGCQCVMIALWTGAGIAKIGPWFQYVLVNMVTNAQFAGLAPTAIKALHRDFPRDMRPSTAAFALATFGTVAECTMGFLCAYEPTRHLGVVVTLGFHTFIASHLPFASVQEWNIFCGWASLVFFGMHPFEWPAGGVHPALAAGLALALVIVPLVGQILPSRVPFLFAFRPYAGNWFFAWHVVSASGQAKLRQLKTAESLFFEENDPESSLAKSAWLKRLAGEHAWLADKEFHRQFVQWGLAAQLVQFPQYRPLVPIVELIESRLGYQSADEYRLFWHMPFLALVHGWNLAAGWHMREGAPYYPAMQRVCGFDEGECLVVVFPPLSLLTRTAEWFVVDVAKTAAGGAGVVMRGKAPFGALEAMQPVEMDVATLQKHIVEDGLKAAGKKTQ